MPKLRSVARVELDRAATAISSGVNSVFTNKKKTAHQGSVTVDGSAVVAGDTTVFVENHEIARAGDDTTKVPIRSGSTNVFADKQNVAGVSRVFYFSIPDPVQVPTTEDYPTEVPGSDLPVQSNGDIIEFLNLILSEAHQWTRGQSPLGTGGNQNIVGIFQNLGYKGFSESVPWCAGFVNFVLKSCGYKYTADLGVRAFLSHPAKWGAEVVYSGRTLDTGWKNASGGDICIWDYGNLSGSHVNFVYSNYGNGLQLCGGNQSSKTPNNNNPTHSSVTNTSKWNPAVDHVGNYHLMRILRPIKR
jgi:uncharacterized Zn-binding protein involved in type VI secretion